MSQTSYQQYMTNGKAGGLADSGVTDKVSASNAAEIPYGKFVVRDTADGSCKLPAADTDVTALKGLGIAIAIQNNEQPYPMGSAVPSYKALSVVSILRKGRAYVLVEEDVLAGDQPTIRHAAGGGGLGSFGKTDDASHVLLPNAVYMTSALSGTLAVVELS